MAIKTKQGLMDGQSAVNGNNKSAPRGRQHSFYVYNRPHARQPNSNTQSTNQPSPTTHDPGFNTKPSGLPGPNPQPAPAPQPPSFANRNSQSRFNTQPSVQQQGTQSSAYRPFAAAPTEPIKTKPKVVFNQNQTSEIKPVWEVPMPKELELENKPLNMQAPPKQRNLLGGKLRKPIQKEPKSNVPSQAPTSETQQQLDQLQPQQAAVSQVAPQPRQNVFDPRQYVPQVQQEYDPSLEAVAPPQQPIGQSPLEEQFASKSKPKRKLNIKRFVPKAMMATAAFVLVAGAVVSFNTFRANNASKSSLSDVANQSSDSNVLGIIDTAPSEDPPTATVGSFASDEPKNIAISSINLDAMVVEVGKSSNNRVKAPGNIYQLGWFNESARPGEEGAVVINGHVEGPTKHGALYSVSKLKSGDKIVVQTGNGGKFTYTVQAVEKFEEDNIDMSKMLTPYTYGRKGLNIMTVGGRFNSKTNKYELRYAVYATQDN